jgi:hypothetical protein
VVLGGSALVFAVLAVPLIALSNVDFPSIEFFGDEGESAPTSTTLAALPASQCAVLRTLRDTGNAAFDATFDGPLGPTWGADRAGTDAALARYEFALQAARPSLPAQFSDDLRQVAEYVNDGRAILADSVTRHEYRYRVASEVTGGYFVLTDIETQLGSACGNGFTFWPPNGVELVAS